MGGGEVKNLMMLLEENYNVCLLCRRNFTQYG